MKKSKPGPHQVLEIVDLFCGAGGTSTGVLQTAKSLGLKIRLTAVNHWDTAINSHSLNHPEVFHICEPVENLWPPRVIPRRRLRILFASCECTFHSIARGGGPCLEQSRSQPWQIVRWASDLDIEDIIMENVKEWIHWGPLLTKGIKFRGRYYKKNYPDPRRKGEFFQAFVTALRNLGYRVEWRLQNAADFGDATNRVRLILIARKHKPIVWPEPTHGPGRAHPWRTAREIIDWTMPGQSIFNRKRPLSENTMRRIEAGLRKFGGPAAEPFLLMMRGSSAGHLNNSKSVDEPLDTVTTSGKHHYLVAPFLLPHRNFDNMYVDGVDQPVRTITAQSSDIALVEPFVTHTTHHGKRRTHSVKEPLPTVTGAHRGEMAVVEPCLVNLKGQSKAADLDKPMPTQTAGARHLAVVEPIIVQTDQTGSNGACTQSVDTPLGTVVTKQNRALIQPCIVKYYGRGVGCKTVDSPLDTVTCKDRFLLVEPKIGRVLAELDIRFRMLQPHELAAAHTFPTHYQFTGTKEDQTAQIGNSVPVKLAEAHAKACLQ